MSLVCSVPVCFPSVTFSFNRAAKKSKAPQPPKRTGRTCPAGENGVIRTRQYDTAYAPQFQLGCEFGEQSSLGRDEMYHFGKARSLQNSLIQAISKSRKPNLDTDHRGASLETG